MKKHIELPCLFLYSSVGEWHQIMIVPASKNSAGSNYFNFCVKNGSENSKPSEILLYPSEVKAMADYLLMRLKDLDYKESDSK